VRLSQLLEIRSLTHQDTPFKVLKVFVNFQVDTHGGLRVVSTVSLLLLSVPFNWDRCLDLADVPAPYGHEQRTLNQELGKITLKRPPHTLQCVALGRLPASWAATSRVRIIPDQEARDNPAKEVSEWRPLRLAWVATGGIPICWVSFYADTICRGAEQRSSFDRLCVNQCGNPSTLTNPYTILKRDTGKEARALTFRVAARGFQPTQPSSTNHQRSIALSDLTTQATATSSQLAIRLRHTTTPLSFTTQNQRQPRPHAGRAPLRGVHALRATCGKRCQ
jgi:hypothetical protein